MSAETVGSTATAAPRARKKKRSGLWAMAFVVVAAGGGYYYWKQSQPTVEEAQPLLATVAIGDVENSVAGAGKLEPFKTVAVGAQASGQLQRLYVEIGDTVAEGDLLAEIDARVQENRVKSSEASIESAKRQLEVRRSALKLAEENFARQQMLFDQEATSQQEYDSAYDRLISAQASLFQQQMSITQSELSLETDRTQLEYTQIKAPVAGTVVSIEMEEGRTLNASQSSPTVLNIADLSRMTIKAEISEADIGNIEDGMEVYFTTLGSGNRRWYSSLRAVLPTPTVTNNVVTYTGLFEIDNDDGALKPGMTTQVFFVTSAARGVVTVPIGALTFADNARGGTGGDLTRVAAAGGQGGAADAEALRAAMRARAEGAGGVEGGAPSGFPQGAFGNGGRGGAFAGGRQGGGRQGGGGGAMARANGGGFGGPGIGQPVQPRRATVKVWNEATQTSTEREVMVGLTSRVAAEVLSGLTPGEQVVAGIIEANQPQQQQNQNNNNNRNNNDWRGGGFPGGGFGGGGRGGW